MPPYQNARKRSKNSKRKLQLDMNELKNNLNKTKQKLQRITKQLKAVKKEQLRKVQPSQMYACENMLGSCRDVHTNEKYLLKKARTAMGEEEKVADYFSDKCNKIVDHFNKCSNIIAKFAENIGLKVGKESSNDSTV